MQGQIDIDGRTIRVLRVFRGWSQRELGQVTGIKPWRLWRLEQGLCAPRSDEITRIVGALSTEDG